MVVGNPPYVEYNKVKGDYTVKGYETESCGNLYAMMIERSYSCLDRNGRFGMITQISFSSTDRMRPIQKFCSAHSKLWLSHFDGRPAKLFDVLGHIRLTIILAGKSNVTNHISYSTTLKRWYTEARSHLFNTIDFGTPYKNKYFKNTLPKIGSSISTDILKRIIDQKMIVKHKELRNKTIYIHNAPLYWIRATDFIPYFHTEQNGEQISTHVKNLDFPSQHTQTIIAILNSSLFYWWFILLSNCRDLTFREISSFPCDMDAMTEFTKKKLHKQVKELMRSFKKHSQRKTRHQRATGLVTYDEFYQKHSKSIVDKIDQILAQHYELTEEELDFIINYDIKYRMG